MGALVSPSLKSYLDAPLARHRVVARHESVTQVTIKILDVSVDTVRRKVLEGIWIRRRKPEMNGKKEMEETLSLLN